MQRTWTWINEAHEPTEDMREAVSAECAALMHRWNQLEAQNEVRSVFACDEYAYDHDAEAYAEEAQELADERGLTGRDAAEFVENYVDEQLNARDAEREAQREKVRKQQEVILQLLAALGARLARPYEHWNEDERMMQYLEEDRWR